MDNSIEKHCKCHHHKVAPLLLVVLGIVFLLGSIGQISLQVIATSFSIIVIFVGLVKFVGGMCKCYSAKHW
ncbi:MAG: hypothetical protein AAB795_02190 [Patescibacteria group bacterium]